MSEPQRRLAGGAAQCREHRAQRRPEIRVPVVTGPAYGTVAQPTQTIAILVEPPCLFGSVRRMQDLALLQGEEENRTVDQAEELVEVLLWRERPYRELRARAGRAPGGPRSAEVAQQLRAAAMDAGFFYIRNHGVPPEVVARQFDIARELMELPLERREALHAALGTLLRC